jgi:hypothetical protein
MKQLVHLHLHLVHNTLQYIRAYVWNEWLLKMIFAVVVAAAAAAAAAAHVPGYSTLPKLHSQHRRRFMVFKMVFKQNIGSGSSDSACWRARRSNLNRIAKSVKPDIAHAGHSKLRILKTLCKFAS